MRTLMFFGILAVICWSAQAASAQSYRDTSGDAINPEKAINQSRSNAHIQLGQEIYAPQRSYRAGSFAPGAVVMPAPANANLRAGTNQVQANASAQAGQLNRGDQWRYRHQNGQWWYYQTNNRWLLWNGSRWTEPMAQAGSTQNQTGSHQ